MAGSDRRVSTTLPALVLGAVAADVPARSGPARGAVAECQRRIHPVRGGPCGIIDGMTELARFDDARRVAALADYRMLDTDPERVFDDITQLASKLFQTPIALVSLVDEHRLWFKSQVGLAARESPREYAFCDHAIRAGATFVVPDAAADPRFAANPLVTGEPHIRFYCGVPLCTPEGHALGTLCIIDQVPRTLTAAEVDVLESLARQVETELELRRRLLLMEELLARGQEAQQEKELFAAMMVHDLRNPLTSIGLLAMTVSPADEASQGALAMVGQETERVRHMLNDALDICLHGMRGLRVLRVDVALDQLVRSIAARFAHRGHVRGQLLRLELPPPPVVVEVDPELLERVIENLLANAMIHGPANRPIDVVMRRLRGGAIRLEIRDHGPPLTPELAAVLFRPFQRHASAEGIAQRSGHGLGLAFCLLAIEAHGGLIGVEPGDGRGNCFYVELPATCS